MSLTLTLLLSPSTSFMSACLIIPRLSSSLRLDDTCSILRYSWLALFFSPPPLFLHSCLIQPLFLSSFFKLWYYLSAISPFWSASLPLIPFSSHSLYTSYVFALAFSSSPVDDLDWCLLSPFFVFAFGFFSSLSPFSLFLSHHFFSLTFKTFSLTFFFWFLPPLLLFFHLVLFALPLPAFLGLFSDFFSFSVSHLSFSPLLPPKLQEETDIVSDFGIFAWLFGWLEIDLSDGIAFLSFEVIFLFMGLWS